MPTMVTQSKNMDCTYYRGVISFCCRQETVPATGVCPKMKTRDRGEWLGREKEEDYE